MRDSFTPLELAAFDQACVQFPADGAALTAQLLTAKNHRRENTGGGFYTYFEVSDGAPLAGERLRNAGYVRVDGLEHEVGFILWFKDGFADCLEAFAVESTVNIDFTVVGFGIFFEPAN